MRCGRAGEDGERGIERILREGEKRFRRDLSTGRRDVRWRERIEGDV